MNAGLLPTIGKSLFRLRSGTPVPLAIWIIARSHLSFRTLVSGLPTVAVGLLFRMWSVAWIGPDSRTRSVDRPEHRVTGGPYRFVKHPLYVANGILSEGLVIASGAGRPWLPILFPLIWFLQYGPIMAWEESQVSDLPTSDCETTSKSERVRTAWTSERRTRQSVGIMIFLLILSRIIRLFRRRNAT